MNEMRLESCGPVTGSRASAGTFSARSTCRNSCANPLFRGTPPCRPAPSCRRTSIRPRTNSCTSSRVVSTSCSMARRILPNRAILCTCRAAFRTVSSTRATPPSRRCFGCRRRASLYDLFWAIHNMGADPDPAKLVATSAEHEVDFLPAGRRRLGADHAGSHCRRRRRWSDDQL